MLMRAATVVQVVQNLFYCMFYFTCDRSFSRPSGVMSSCWRIGLLTCAISDATATVCSVCKNKNCDLKLLLLSYWIQLYQQPPLAHEDDGFCFYMEVCCHKAVSVRAALFCRALHYHGWTEVVQYVDRDSCVHLRWQSSLIAGLLATTRRPTNKPRSCAALVHIFQFSVDVTRDDAEQYVTVAG